MKSLKLKYNKNSIKYLFLFLVIFLLANCENAVYFEETNGKELNGIIAVSKKNPNDSIFFYENIIYFNNYGYYYKILKTNNSQYLLYYYNPQIGNFFSYEIKNNLILISQLQGDFYKQRPEGTFGIDSLQIKVITPDTLEFRYILDFWVNDSILAKKFYYNPQTYKILDTYLLIPKVIPKDQNFESLKKLIEDTLIIIN